MNSSFCVAVHALVYLNHKACMLSSEDLAENICTNPARVRKVMSALKKAGLVYTKEGSVGGYQFTGDPEHLTLDRVADALSVRFVESSWRSGDSDMECLVASGMADLMDELYLDLDARCKERLTQISIADLDHRIFSTRRQKESERSMV